MRKPPGLPKDQLCACIQDQYNLIAVTLEFLPLGLDCNAVYRVVNEQGTSLFLKATPVALYEPGYLVPHALSEQGVSSVVAPVPTRDGALWTTLLEWTVTLFPFIEGESGATRMTDAHWKALGSTLQRVHQFTLPAAGFGLLLQETFDPTPEVRWVQAFEDDSLSSRTGWHASLRVLRACWREHRPSIHLAVTRLQRLAELLQRRSLPFVLCHADLKPANLIHDQHDQVWVIDWDEVMLAPKERDLLWTGGSSDVSEDWRGLPAFWEGYGPRAIDPVAFTYYQHEQIVQELITCANAVCSRGEEAEEVRAEALQRVQEILAPGGVMDVTSRSWLALSL